MNADQQRAYPHAALTERVIGVFYDVYNELGFGFLESVYEAAFQRAHASAGLHFAAQKAVPVRFRGEVIAEFKLDLVVENVVVLEIKAVSALAAVHEAQLLNYLKATSLPVGLLLNFGPRPEVRRRVFDAARRDLRSSA